MKIEIGSESIDAHVQYGKGKKMSIHIDVSGFITVKAPKGTTDERVRQTVEQHGTWILEKIRSLEEARSLPKAREYQDEGTFLYLGKTYLLHELIDTGELSEEELRQQLKKFYFASCKKIIGERIEGYQTRLKVKPKSIEIVESKTKWGSCSASKMLTFNYRLAMAPLDVIDYVIIHELCHLTHMNHDRSFWRRVGSIMPDYKAKQEFLERHGQAMTL
ncbi:M48 family metallopeptidase [Paenibacillus nasutitermitis]|nr:SprT family zinc-dependent metalloprotease [Paenibacillus nasutitermitis]